MRFLQPDLHRHDRAWIHRWNDPVAASVFHCLLIDHQNLSAQLSGISAIVIPAHPYVDADDPCPSAIRRQPVWQGVSP
jgi:hypothetical protein